MKSISDRIAQANSLLAPYAVIHGGGLGREYPEPNDSTRFPFQRDRDRIIHTQAFRRLKHKTQVFVTGLPAVALAKAGHGDHYRTRITHTLEVAQISRDIARTLGLNEDLAEAIALAHDLGHTPFGHAGEEAMNECMQSCGRIFEHNDQSLRIVTVLEDRSAQYRGLNLSKEILEGLMKHPTPPRAAGLRGTSRTLSLEAQLVNLADEIAYTAHDTDDGLRAGLFTLKQVRETKLGFLAAEKSKERKTELRGAIVDLLVSDLYVETESLLKKFSIVSLVDVYASRVSLLSFSKKMADDLGELRKFLWNHLYKSSAVQMQAKHGQQVIRDLFAVYKKSPPAKVLELQKKTGGALEEAIKDYVAGMTDPFAMQRWEAIKI
ncbi:dNTP triphosphohydrolase [Candidatus Peribacteria bacterium]|nr:dNTP triphosphohydrolase [Candidatus Peribacteria bacterium]